MSAGLRQLVQTCAGLAFEPHDIASQLDPRGRYRVGLDREFPLLIKLFHYSSERHTRGGTWHDRLELFCPLDGEVRVQMGSRLVHLAPGDLLVVDNLKLHCVVDFPGFDSRVIVTSFLPELVYSLGSPSHDYAFLLPFYSKGDGHPRVLRATEPAASAASAALARLLDCYFGRERELLQAGSKAYLLEVLYHVARHFREAGLVPWELLRQQQRSLRLRGLFEHIREHYVEKLSVAEAAGLVNMSSSQFMKAFKRVAGMTLVSYLNHVRLSQAARLLKETDLTIATIASQVGFADQSYFDRCFRRHFGLTPRACRHGG